MSTVIETKALTKAYGGAAAVQNVSFKVQRGEVIGFVGLNGAGKSTTINMLLGFQKPTAGEVYLFGKKVTLPGAYRSHQNLGFATGDMSLFDRMTGEQYLRFVAKSYGTRLKTAVYARLVERFEPQLHKRLNELSRGNKQKIALIAAFMTEPELIILDEPSSGLDPLMQQHFIELVREESGRGATIFMSSHYLNEVTDVCTRILLIKKGALVKDVPTSQLENVAGKLVKVVTAKPVRPPTGAEASETEKSNGGHTLQFIYKGASPHLQKWLGTVPGLHDLTITDHSVEAAFEDLYEDDATNRKEPAHV